MRAVTRNYKFCYYGLSFELANKLLVFNRHLGNTLSRFFAHFHAMHFHTTHFHTSGSCRTSGGGGGGRVPLIPKCAHHLLLALSLLISCSYLIDILENT